MVDKIRPTKRCKVKYCIINGKLNTIEMEEMIAPEIIADPLMPNWKNGIDFIYSEEMRQLTCNVRLTSVTVSNADVAKSRISSADVKQPTTSAYVGAWFLHNRLLHEIVSISGDNVTCRDPDVDDDGPLIELPLPLVSQLVNSFG